MLKYLPPGGGTSGLINNEIRRNENNDYEMLKYFVLDRGVSGLTNNETRRNETTREQ